MATGKRAERTNHDFRCPIGQASCLICAQKRRTKRSPEKTANISRRYHWFPREMTSEVRAQKFNTDDDHYPDLCNASDWLKHISLAIRPKKHYPGQIWVVTRHQCGIYAAFAQTLFYGEISGGIAKCRFSGYQKGKLFDAISRVPLGCHQGRSSNFDG